MLVTLLQMRPHYSRSSRENATPSSGTSPVVSYKEVPPGVFNAAFSLANQVMYWTIFIANSEAAPVFSTCQLSQTRIA